MFDLVTDSFKPSSQYLTYDDVGDESTVGFGYLKL